MVITVNPMAVAGAVAPFRDEAVYAFRFDTDGDSREDTSFRTSFGLPAEGVADLRRRGLSIRRIAAQLGPGTIDDIQGVGRNRR
jgi:hypothetical protein